MASPLPSDNPTTTTANGISTPPTSNPTGATQNTSSPTARGTPPNAEQSGSGTGSGGVGSGHFGVGGPGNPGGNSNGNGNPNDTANPLLPNSSINDSGLGKRPRDARLLHLVLANQGVQSYEERVPLQLLDFAYRYSSGVLSDALAISADMPTGGGGGSGRAARDTDASSGISLNALRQSIASRSGYQFSSTLPKEYLLDLAAERNRIQLPKVEREYGLRLPGEKWTLTGTGWSLKDEWESEEEFANDEMEGPPESGEAGEKEDVVMGDGDAASGADKAGDKDEDMEDEFEDAMGTTSKADGMEM